VVKEPFLKIPPFDTAKKKNILISYGTHVIMKLFWNVWPSCPSDFLCFDV